MYYKKSHTKYLQPKEIKRNIKRLISKLKMVFKSVHLQILSNISTWLMILDAGRVEILKSTNDIFLVLLYYTQLMIVCRMSRFWECSCPDHTWVKRILYQI